MKVEHLKYNIKLHFNHLLKRTYIPEQTTHLYIEPSSICNLKCRFCAYQKADYPKKVMPGNLFEDIVDKATEFGFTDFGLTPITGDIFTDKLIAEKLLFLENHPKVKSYSFYTNFVLVDREKIDFLLSLRKLTQMSISLYGHDLISFKALTGGSENQHRKLLTNLSYLSENYKEENFDLQVALRSTLDFDGSNFCTSVQKVMRTFGNSIDFVHTPTYDTWGGMVTPEDVAGINIELRYKPVKKIGACALIFYKNQVHSDGKVNACACRDVLRSMEIGDLNSQTFSEIYSMDNQKLVKLIEDQQQGKFSEICDNCDFYRSIYYNYDVYNQRQYTLTDFQSYQQVLKANSVSSDEREVL